MPVTPPRYSQQKALREELPDETLARRANRRAHGNFTRTGRGPGEEQARHVDAGNQEKQADGRE